MLRDYFRKMSGITKSPPRVSATEMMWSWVGGFIAISLVAYLNDFVLEGSGKMLIIGSFGASAVLLFGAVRSPLAQPPNLVGGHLVSAVIGVAAFQLFPSHLWLAAGISVATAIAAMHATKTLHPPGGATALIAVIGGPKIHELGFFYAVMPVGVGVVIMLLVALFVNNIPKNRRYPEFWF